MENNTKKKHPILKIIGIGVLLLMLLNMCGDGGSSNEPTNEQIRAAYQDWYNRYAYQYIETFTTTDGADPEPIVRELLDMVYDECEKKVWYDANDNVYNVDYIYLYSPIWQFHFNKNGRTFEYVETAYDSSGVASAIQMEYYGAFADAFGDLLW